MKLPTIFFRIEIEERVLRLNKIKITGENIFNGDHFVIEGNYGSSKDANILFGIFFQIFDQCFDR